MRFAPTTFRPLFGRVLSVIVGAVGLVALGGFVVVGDWSGLVRYGWLPVLLVVAVFAMFWLPSVSVAEHAVTVRNVLSTVTVPWPAIQRIDTKFALTLYTSGGKVTAWASPAPNRYAGQVTMTKDARLASRESGGAIRPGDLLETASGAVAYVIRRHWEELRDDGLLDAGAEPGSVRRDIHWPIIAVLAALLLATVLGVVL